MVVRIKNVLSVEACNASTSVETAANDADIGVQKNFIKFPGYFMIRADLAKAGRFSNQAHGNGRTDRRAEAAAGSFPSLPLHPERPRPAARSGGDASDGTAVP